MRKSLFKSQSGQSLIALLFFMVIGITVISAAALVVASDILSSSNSEVGQNAYFDAESGVEDGILYVLSHPTSSASLTLPNTNVTITYAGGTSTITSVGTEGTTSRSLSAQVTNGTVSNWMEQ